MHAASLELLYCPLVHEEHAGDPTNEDLPASQVVHAAAAVSEYVPAPQAIQPAPQAIQPAARY